METTGSVWLLAKPEVIRHSSLPQVPGGLSALAVMRLYTWYTQDRVLAEGRCCCCLICSLFIGVLGWEVLRGAQEVDT